MCENCYLSICSSRCPNAREPKAIYTCAYCGDGIVPGDETVGLDGEYYHRECFMDNAANILLRDFGAVLFTAESEEG